MQLNLSPDFPFASRPTIEKLVASSEERENDDDEAFLYWERRRRSNFFHVFCRVYFWCIATKK